MPNWLQKISMPLDPGAWSYEESPHRLQQHQPFVIMPGFGTGGYTYKIPQPQDPTKLEKDYYGVHVTQNFNLASIYANNRATKDDPPVVIELATDKQWEPDVDAIKTLDITNYADEKIKEIEGLEEQIQKFQASGQVDWEYITEVFSEVEDMQDIDDYYGWENEELLTETVSEELAKNVKKIAPNIVADFFLSFYGTADSKQLKFEFYIPEYLRAFYYYYLVPLFYGGAHDNRLDAYFIDQMRFMEAIEDEEIIAVYQTEWWKDEIYDPYRGFQEEEPEPEEQDEEGRTLLDLEEVMYFSPSSKAIWESPYTEQIKRNPQVQTYYHGTSLSRAKKALPNLLGA